MTSQKFASASASADSVITSQVLREEALWKELSGVSQCFESFSKIWLALQCSKISGVSSACLVLRAQTKYKPVAFWPERNEDTKVITQAAESALRERKSIVMTANAGDINSARGSRVQVARPIFIDDDLIGVVALEVAAQSQTELTRLMRQLQWGMVWIENYFRQKGHAEDGQLHARMVTAFKLSTLCIDHSDFNSAAIAVATEWATQLGCEKVSIGMVKGSGCKIVALSHDMDFDKRTNGIRLLGNAMDEAIDQKKTVVSPRNLETYVSRAHAELSTHSGNPSTCTVLLLKQDSVDIKTGSAIVGAVTLEHQEADFFSEDVVQLCQQIALIVGPLLHLKAQEDRWIGRKLADSFHAQVKRLIGYGHYKMKLVVLLLPLIVLFFAITDAPYRVTAEATIEGWTQRHITSPIDGYIIASELKAGDLVEQGQLLFTLDNRDLKLERQKWMHKKSQIEKQHLNALVQQDYAQAGILIGQLDQASAQLDLISEQLSRTEAKAPFSGIVVAGDLTQRLGSPVTRGESLMKISPLNDYRIILNVDQRDIASIAENQTGVLTLAALNAEIFAFSVEKITPVATTDEGVSYFRVEAKLLASAASLRPGMQGSAKIDIGERNLWWVWTHSLTDWIKIWFWRWWP